MSLVRTCLQFHGQPSRIPGQILWTGKFWRRNRIAKINPLIFVVLHYSWLALQCLWLFWKLPVNFIVVPWSCCLNKQTKKTPQKWEEKLNVSYTWFHSSSFDAGEWKKAWSHVWFDFWCQEFCSLGTEEKGSSAGTCNWRGISALNTWQRNTTLSSCAEYVLKRLMNDEGLFRSMSQKLVIYAIASYKHICHSKM